MREGLSSRQDRLAVVLPLALGREEMVDFTPIPWLLAAGSGSNGVHVL